MNQIIYNGDTVFHGDAAANGTDGLIMSGSVEQRISLFGEELAEDTMTFRINSNALTEQSIGYSYLYTVNMEKVQTHAGEDYVIDTGSVDWRNFTYGAPVVLYNKPGGTIIGRFYLLDVKQVSRKTLEFVCTDGIGMLARMGDHNGGLYTGQNFRSIAASIFAGSNINYGFIGNVGDEVIRGRLPRQNRRLNLAQLLIATGATLVENGGKLYIKYLSQNSPTALNKVYLEGNDISYGDELATEVQVTEHSFYALASDQETTLFDNTGEAIAISNQLVVFDEPCHDLTTTGTLTVSESNVNYAVVSGIGTLVGKEYTHNTRVITRATGLSGERNVKALEDNQLVGLHNSANVSKRMATYYSTPIAAKVEALDPNGTIQPGTLLSFTDAFGTARTGWLRTKQFALGNKTRASLDLLTGWTPGPFGSSYNAYRVFRAANISNGRLTFPAAMVGKQALIMLFGGAQGGQGGFDGEDGEAPQGYENVGVDAAGGLGGMPGEPGERGKVLSVQVDTLPAYYDNAAIGAGGLGGSRNGGIGAEGGATTLGAWSSADGSQLLDEHINLIDGTVYAEANVPGLEGGNGGWGRGIGDEGQGTSTEGDSVSTYSGGQAADGSAWHIWTSSGRIYYDSGGQGGGGAAYGHAGGDATAATEDDEEFDGYGGNGANASTWGRAAETRPGRGGNGGGGGGGSVLQLVTRQWSGSVSYGWNNPGTGGTGSAGGPGGNGLILVYYNA